MYKSYLTTFVCILLVAFVYGQDNSAYYQKGEEPVFTENMGQVLDEGGKPVTDVLAKASVDGLDIYITRTGITYVLLQYVEDKEAKPHPVYINEHKCKINFSRIDVALAGATISKKQFQFKEAVAILPLYCKQDGPKANKYSIITNIAFALFIPSQSGLRIYAARLEGLKNTCQVAGQKHPLLSGWQQCAPPAA
jgi:hypothetical protein